MLLCDEIFKTCLKIRSSNIYPSLHSFMQMTSSTTTNGKYQLSTILGLSALNKELSGSNLSEDYYRKINTTNNLLLQSINSILISRFGSHQCHNFFIHSSPRIDVMSKFNLVILSSYSNILHTDYSLGIRNLDYIKTSKINTTTKGIINNTTSTNTTASNNNIIISVTDNTTTNTSICVTDNTSTSNNTVTDNTNNTTSICVTDNTTTSSSNNTNNETSDVLCINDDSLVDDEKHNLLPLSSPIKNYTLFILTDLATNKKDFQLFSKYASLFTLNTFPDINETFLSNTDFCDLLTNEQVCLLLLNYFKDVNDFNSSFLPYILNNRNIHHFCGRDLTIILSAFSRLREKINRKPGRDYIVKYLPVYAQHKLSEISIKLVELSIGLSKELRYDVWCSLRNIGHFTHLQFKNLCLDWDESSTPPLYIFNRNQKVRLTQTPTYDDLPVLLSNS